MELTKLLYGGDYNPEQWMDAPEILEEDIRLMKEAGINVVSLGIFAWSVLEPEEGNYQFGWLDDIIDRLYQNGISVFLATPSGARPVWLAAQYPEVLRTAEDGKKLRFGGRHNHCFTSPVYRDKVRKINMELAKRYVNHPAVRMWHISNEYNGECHCQLCRSAFRNWLKEKYQTIERLNKSWWTTFWSHHYDSFEQIDPPSTLGEREVHGLNLDWKRFVTYQTTDFMKAEIQALRDGGATQPVTTNFMYDFKGLNYRKLAEEIDMVSWDSYPAWHTGRYIDVARDTAMQHDYMRSLKRKPFLLMESCPSATNWQEISMLKEPGLLCNSSLLAIAHGSDSVQYFQIRQSRGSSEKFHGSVIDHYAGEDTRVFREVREIGNILDSLDALAGSMVHSQVAVLYDVENRWAMEDAQGPRNSGLFYHEAAMKSYQAFRKYGMNVDVIDMEAELDAYQIVAAPMLYMFRSGIAEKLRKYVSRGGILLMTYWSGIVDDTDLCYMGGVPHNLTDVLGLRSEEIDGLPDGKQNHGVPTLGNSLGLRRTYICSHLCDLVRPAGAEVLMTYGSDFYGGKPALLRNTFGKGEAYYICADMEQDFYDDVYARVLEQHGIEGLLTGIPECVDVSSRETETHTYLFIQNYSHETLGMALPAGAEILYGDSPENLKALSTTILRIPK